MYSNDITVCDVSPSNGTLTARAPTVPAGAPASSAGAGGWPQVMALDPLGRFAFVCDLLTREIWSYTIDGTNGDLTFQSSVVLPLAPGGVGPNPASITIHPTGKFAYIGMNNANDIQVFSIDQTTGALALSSTLSNGYSPAAIGIEPTGRFAYATDRNGNEVTTLAIDPTTGALTQKSQLALLSPLQIAFHPNGLFAYVSQSNASAIAVCAIDGTSGALTIASSILTNQNTWGLAIHPTGKFLFATFVTATSSSSMAQPAYHVATYTADATTGALTYASDNTTDDTPYSVAVDASGKYAFVANFITSDVYPYIIDQNTGALTQEPLTTVGSNPTQVWLLR